MAFFRRRYGASPLHLLGHLVAFAVAYYALSEVLLSQYSQWRSFVLWFIGGALLHDLLFLPVYSLLDVIARLVVQDHERLPVRVVNHLRVPTIMAGTMFLVFFPLILGKNTGNYHANTGENPPDYLARWLLICAVLYAASALVYAVRRVSAGRRADDVSRR